MSEPSVSTPAVDPEPRRRSSPLLSLAAGLDRFCVGIGEAVSWLALAMVLVTVLVVVLRYGFDLGWISMQESVTYMHATLFMCGAAYTLSRDGHVRVDIFYRKMSRRGRAWVDLVGTLVLLMPVMGFIAYSAWSYVFESWSLLEGSPEAGGIHGVWLLKTLMLLLALLMLLQGLAVALRNGLFLVGVEHALGAGKEDGVDA